MILPAKPFKLRFSIRSILVMMTLFAIFLCYHLMWIQQRHYERAEFEQYRAAKKDVAGREVMHKHPAVLAIASGRLPLLLKLFGESPQTVIEKNWMDESTWAGEHDRLEAMFPEAVILMNTP